MSTRHARLHKRGYSASAATSPRPLSPVADYDAFTFNRSETPKVFEESWIETQRPMPSTTSSHQLKIKPYLRKLSSKESSGSIYHDLRPRTTSPVWAFQNMAPTHGPYPTLLFPQSTAATDTTAQRPTRRSFPLPLGCSGRHPCRPFARLRSPTHRQ